MNSILFKTTTMLLLCMVVNVSIAQNKEQKYIMVIHGGAGTLTRKNMSVEKEAAYRAALTLALQTGYKTLKAGKTSLDAVEATIHVMEDSPLFNAGKGAVFTHD